MYKTLISRNYKEMKYFWWHCREAFQFIVDIVVVAVFKFYFVLIFLNIIIS